MKPTTRMAWRALIIWMLCAGILRAQETTAPFDLVSNQPVVAHSPSFSDWDGRYTDPGAVFYHAEQFHMFRNGFRAWPASVQIGYLTSPDGLTWTEVTPDPVLLTDDVPYAEVAALASSALVTDDGTWVLYFYTWNNTVPPAGAIGRATAADPLGPWTVDPAPVLSMGSAGEWDSLHIDTPSVVRTDTGYMLFYAGVGENTDSSGIGMATSADGITWTKYDDPATTAAPYAESDPVLVSTQEAYRFHQPRVERVDEQYVMIFRMAPTSGNQMGLGIATSADGIAWDVLTPEPFWGSDSIPGAMGFWFTALAYHDDTFYLYIEGGRGSYTDVYVATAARAFLD